METNNYQQDLQTQALLLEFISRIDSSKLEDAMTKVRNLNNELKSLIYGN